MFDSGGAFCDFLPPSSQMFETLTGLFPPSELSLEQLPPKYLPSAKSAGALWLERASQTRMRIFGCVWRVCILCVGLCVSGHFDSLWWIIDGRRPWDQAPEPPLFFTDWSFQLCGDYGRPPPRLFICLRPKQRRGGCVVKDMPKL